MMRNSFVAVAVMLSMHGTADGQVQIGPCYHPAVGVGCDPEGYGYEARTCPTNCPAPRSCNQNSLER